MDFPLMTNDQRNSIDDEIARIIKLKQKMNIHRESRLKQIKIAQTMTELLYNKVEMKIYKDKIAETKLLVNAHYDTTQRWCDIKIKAWGQIFDNRKDKNMLDKINEAMDEWLQSSWVYFGQEDIIEESNNAKEEYHMFKIILENVKNKPTRRGGKKHKKK